MTLPTPPDAGSAEAAAGAAHLIERAARMMTGAAAPGRVRTPVPADLADAASGQEKGDGPLPLPPSPRPGQRSGHAAAPGRAVPFPQPEQKRPSGEPPPASLPPPAPSRPEARETAAGAAASSPMVTASVLMQEGMAMGHKKRTRTSEEYRIITGRVMRMMRGLKPGRTAANLILVTSARPGEGKSFCSLNIAGSLAQHGLSDTLLVDTDPKSGSMTAKLGLSECPGFLDLIADPRLRPESLLVPTEIPQLSILPVGTRTPELMALAGSRRATSIIETLARQWPSRMIVLDAPPCLSVSDPSSFASIVGQILLVVEAEMTQRNEIEASLDLVKDCPVISLLLNKARLNMNNTFGAYGYGPYGSYL